MSKDRHEPLAEPSNLAVLRAKLRSVVPFFARQAWSWALDNKGISLVAAGVFLLTIPIVISVVAHQWKAEANKPTAAKMGSLLNDALIAVDAGKFREARALMARLDLALLSRDELGTVEFIQGSLAAAEAEEYVGVDRTPRFMAAAEHLKKSRERGFPYQHEARATYLLGKSLFQSGNQNESCDFLEQALPLLPHRAAEIHEMLADAYRLDAEPNLAKALEHNNAYLATPSLEHAERVQAELREAELRLAMGDTAGASQAIDKIPADSQEFAFAAILRGRILLREAEQAQANLPANADDGAREALLS
jgi:hypothetical protein